MRYLIVSPHPDDETLGAGGSLLRLEKEGNDIFWLIVTEGTKEIGWSEEMIEVRNKEIKKVSEAYRFSGVEKMKLPAAGLDQLQTGSIIKDIKGYILDIAPETVIIPDRNDAHSDHKIVFDSCMSAMKVFRCPSVKKILTMEILSESNFGNPYRHFEPNLYMDISDYLDRKCEILSIFKSEIGAHPFPRSMESVRAIATLRGAEAGCRYAEAFHVIKEIV